MKRIFDFLLAIILFGLLFIPMIFIALCVRMTSEGPALHWSDRVGKNNIVFQMPKFRSMLVNAPELATHLFDDADSWLTPIGSFLRKTSLDELPQIWSILIGDMSFVGPRPALYNQSDLIALRTQTQVHELKPGLTGWAQINGRDELSINQKVSLDKYYRDNSSLLLDVKILMLTGKRVFSKQNISH